MVTTTTLFSVPAVIPLLTDNGMLNITLKVSSSSTILSNVIGTLTLLIVIPLSNVAVSVVVSKSTPPVSQTIFSQHIIIHITLLPSADTGDCSDGVTVTSNGLLDVPPTTSNVTITNPVASESVYCVCVNLTMILEESIIIPVALAIEPTNIPGPSEDGTSKFIEKVSFSSTMLSFITATLTVVLVAPAGIVALRGPGLKSLPVLNIWLLLIQAVNMLTFCSPFS